MGSEGKGDPHVVRAGESVVEEGMEVDVGG